MSTEHSSPRRERSSSSEAFHAALGEYLARIDRDGTVALEEFQQRHPEFATRLGKQLDWLAQHLGKRKEGIPAQIGPYRVIQRLGVGGMGEVYLAEQTAPFQRVVAIKVIRTDKTSDGRIARFGAEIQALATLNHDGIAKVFEAGEDQGRPYFTMEYVPGRPVTDYCAEERLGLVARLRLFVRICRTVEHAHQNGILHRDLKPTNILVYGPHDDPVLKIIDFGLAKAIAPEDSAARRTLTGQVLGTPDYMSPEQVAEDNHRGVDTRADVYSLGVVLYELLTGVLPLSLWQMGRDDFRAMLRAIRERQPSSPSVRVEEAVADGTPSPALGDGTTPHRLSRMLAGDLDAIVMKALAKDVERRYPSVASLADDILRHLRHEPVLARPATRGYVLRKFVRRHRAAVAFTMTLLVVTFSALVVINVLAQANIRSLERGDLFGIAHYLEQLRQEDVMTEAARPEHVEALTARLRELETLFDSRPRLQAFLAATAPATVSAADTADGIGGARVHSWSSGIKAIATLRATVHETDELLAAMAQPGAEFDKLRLRIDWAKRVVGLTVEAHRAQWERVAAEVRADTRFGTLELRPQPGLIPLRKNPDTGLQEFALPLPGCEMPRRTAEGYEMGPRTCPVFVLLPGGTVEVGGQNKDRARPRYDGERFVGEADVREETIAPFFASMFEFTNGQWNLVDSGVHGADPADLFTGATQPVVNFNDEWVLHILSAWGMRLPTEVEWEYLARGGTDTPYWSGATAASLRGNANVHDQSLDRDEFKAEGTPADWFDGYDVTAPVGSFAPNPFGLRDVHGNAAEVAVRTKKSGQVGDDEMQLELRGGSWHQGPQAARITATVRWHGQPLYSLGCRPVISIAR